MCQRTLSFTGDAERFLQSTVRKAFRHREARGFPNPELERRARVVFEAFFDIIPYPDHSDHGHTLKAVANEDPPYTRYLLQHQDLIIEYLACPNTVIFEVAYWSRAARKRYQFTPFDPEQSMENYF